MRWVQSLPDQRTSAFLAILDPDHDLHSAIADMTILNQLDQACLRPVLNSLQPEDLLLWDTNLNPEPVSYTHLLT